MEMKSSFFPFSLPSTHAILISLEMEGKKGFSVKNNQAENKQQVINDCNDGLA
jgi:hypothetical protein